MAQAPLHTVVEMPRYIARAAEIMSDEEKTEVAEKIAANPNAGDLIKNSGGIRKLRIALAGRGKSGGGRVIYFFHGVKMPIFLLTVYAKNRQADLSAAELASYRALTEALVKTYRSTTHAARR